MRIFDSVICSSHFILTKMSPSVRNCGIAMFYILFLWFTEISLICCFQRFDPDGMRIQKVSCNHTGMEVRITSRSIFKGIIYTQGNAFNPSCRYNAPEMGTKELAYFIPLTDCGNLLREVDGYIYISNSIIVQKHRVVETDSDIVQSLSCKLPVSQSKDMQLFSHIKHPTRLQDKGLESWLDFYSGADILGVNVPNKVSVGDEFSIVVHLKDGGAYKDLEVEKCWAHDNESIATSSNVVQIFNLYACQYSDWIPGFTLSKGMENISDVMVFGLLKAFKFPSTNNLHITCSIQICDNFCMKYCEIDSKKSDNFLLRIKRSEPEVIPGRGLNKRHRLMKATIKALGAKLIERNKGGLSRNNSNFYRRSDEVQNGKVPNIVLGRFKSETVGSPPQEEIVSEPVGRPDEHEILHDADKALDITANNVYTFNLTNNLVVFTDHEFNFRYEYRNAPRNALDCVAKPRFLIATISLSFIVLSLIVACISLMCHIRKVKRKMKKIAPNNFFLYDLY